MELAAVEALKVVLRYDDVGESELLGLCHALLYAVDGSHLARQSYLAGHAPSLVYGRVDVGGEYGGDDGEVHGHVGDAQSAGDVEEDILLRQLEAHALFEHGQQHVEAALVEAGGRALGGAVGCRRDEGLGLYEEGSDALDGTRDGHARESVVVVGEQQLRGVRDLSQSRLLHLVNA